MNAAGGKDFNKTLGASLGFVICLIWLRMLISDWRFLTSRLAEAGRFRWAHLGKEANPFVTMLEGEGRKYGQDIFHLAIFLVWIFLGLYAELVIYEVWPLIVSVYSLIKIRC